jgi:fructose transport system permease protein
LVALLLAMAFFSFKSDRFLEAQNLSLVLQQVMVVGVLAIGQTLVILTAGIDLSVGTVMALGQIVMTKLAIENGMTPLLAIALGILTCVAFGVLNGSLVTLVRLPPFIVTLGTLNIAFALTHIVSNDLTFSAYRASCSSSAGRSRRRRGLHLRRRLHARAVRDRVVRAHADALGRHVYAVGDNREAARLTGINTTACSRASTRSPASPRDRGAAARRAHRARRPERGQTTENLDSITAVVLGGTSLFGGGDVIGTLIGATIVGVFRNGLTLIGVAGDLPVPRHGHPRHPRRLGRPADAPESGVSAAPLLEARGSSSATATSWP